MAEGSNLLMGKEYRRCRSVILTPLLMYIPIPLQPVPCGGTGSMLFGERGLWGVSRGGTPYSQVRCAPRCKSTLTEGERGLLHHFGPGLASGGH